MNLLNREAILSAQDRKFEEVEVPEWGGTVRVATIPAADQDRWVAKFSANGEADQAMFRAGYVALCCVDGEGARIFKDEDTRALGSKSASAIRRVFDVAAKLNGLTEGAELEKNFDAGPSAGSSSE
jgi:hypothetical protein